MIDEIDYAGIQLKSGIVPFTVALGYAESYAKGIDLNIEGLNIFEQKIKQMVEPMFPEFIQNAKKERLAPIQVEEELACPPTAGPAVPEVGGLGTVLEAIRPSDFSGARL
jgi:hypothetical protein